MEIHNLSRKELQALCKKNKIPANMANVAMADALSTLQHVEGLEELQYPTESHPKESPKKFEIESPASSRTAYRTATRRKPVKEEPKTSQALTRSNHGSSSSAEEKAANEENKDSNLLQTPDVPKTGKRVTAASSRRKMETGKEESSVQRVYSTRRSVRLLEKTMGNLCLTGNEQTEPLMACNLIEKMPERSEFNTEKTDDSNTDDLFSPENEEEAEADIGEGSNTDEVKMLKENRENLHEEKDEDNDLNDEVNEGPNYVSATEVDDEPETQYDTSKLENMEGIIIHQEEESVNLESIEASAEMKDDEWQKAVSENSGMNTSGGDVEESDETMDDYPRESFPVTDVEIVEEGSDDSTESEETNSVLDPSNDDEALVDINVMEEEGSMTPKSVKPASHAQVEDYVNTLIEVTVKPGEISMGSLDSSSKITGETSSLTPFPVDRLSGQFPRPTTISSSVEIKKAAVLKMDDISDYEEENKTENTTLVKVDDVSDNDEINSENASDKPTEELSLRQLKKKLRELNISKKKIQGEKDASKAGGKARTALQPIVENCISKDGRTVRMCSTELVREREW